MISVQKGGILLDKTNFEFECDGVLNPAAIKTENDIHIFYRAVAKGNVSSIGYCLLSDPNTISRRLDYPVIVPEFAYEKHGVEDPRIVQIDNTFYLTYTAYDGINALGALATSKDLLTWIKHGIIVPEITYKEFKFFSEIDKSHDEKYVRFNEYQISHQENTEEVYLWCKNLVFFPRKINNRFYFLLRIKPDIQIVAGIEKIEDLTSEFWNNYFLNFKKHIVISPKYQHEISYIGSGCPPIETNEGWLIIYHGVHDSVEGYVYCACAALLDLENPSEEISRLPYPLFEPEEKWELKGEVNNVCFPTGAVVEGDLLYIYYGAADQRIALASLKISELLAELIKYK